MVLKLRAAGQNATSRTQPSRQVEIVRSWTERGNGKNLKQKKLINVSGELDFLIGYRITLPSESTGISCSSVSAVCTSGEK